MNARKFPRTMAEAFGPYEGRGLYSKAEPMHKNDKIVLLACAVAVPALIAALFIWS